jgi:long-chain acyl-CoA synthetase
MMPAEYREPVLGFVDQEAGIDPDKPAVLISERSLSYADVDRRSAALAHVMVGHGVGVDDPVAVMLPNGFEIMEAGIATAKAGAAFLPVNWHLGSDEVGWILSDSGTRLLISHIDLADTARAALEHAPGCALVLVGDESPQGYETLLSGAPAGDPDVEARASLSYRFYTSGTTGRPRGVERDNAVDDRTGASTRRVLRMWGITSSDVFLATGPIYHAAGSYAFLSLHAGSTVSVLPKFDGLSWLDAVDRHRVSVTLMVPAHFIRVLEVPAEQWAGLDLSSLRLVLHAAAPCPISVKRRIMDALPSADIWEFYGASEGGVSRISPDEWRDRPGSVGRPWPGVEVTIRDEDGTVLGPGETGLVYMTSPGGRFKYHQDPGKTEAAWRGESYTLGDVGHLDSDGYLYLTDRAADVVIRGGVNIYPAEIEQVLATHPAVVDCAVFGVPDDRSGEAIRALVELRTPTDAADLVEHCRAHLAAYKCPQEIIEVPELPRDPSGKVRKRHLRDHAWDGHANRIRVD